MFAEWRLFQKVATGILVVFMGIMVFVTVVAHLRPSGSTRQDMAQAQFLRKEALERDHQVSSPLVSINATPEGR